MSQEKFVWIVKYDRYDDYYLYGIFDHEELAITMYKMLRRRALEKAKELIEDEEGDGLESLRYTMAQDVKAIGIRQYKINKLYN